LRRPGGARLTVRARGALTLLETDGLRAFPEALDSELVQVLWALDDRREVIAGEWARLRAERDVPVREEQLRLADPAGEQQQLAGVREPGCILGAEAELQVAEGNPHRLAAPADVDDPAVEREHAAEAGDRLGSRFLLEPGREAKVAGDDLEHLGHRLRCRPQGVRALPARPSEIDDRSRWPRKRPHQGIFAPCAIQRPRRSRS